LVGITNDLTFRDRLDQRIKSSLGEEEVLFKPYNATQLKNILVERVNEGFIHSTVDPSAINKCAAIAAQEHGDARKALDLLRVAGELADRDGETTVTEAHVDMAERKLDIDRVAETIKSQPLHSQTILYSAIRCMGKRQEAGNWADTRILTGDLFDAYSKTCAANGTKVLTQRRFSDLVGELDMLGIISTKVISKGRHGRTREITLAINGSALEKAKTFLETRFR
jgi:cell division control protein 6